MINELTEEQKQKLPEYADKWMKICLEGAPANRPGAQEALRKMYKQGGFNDPQVFIWVSSPHQLCVAAAYVFYFEHITKKYKVTNEGKMLDAAYRHLESILEGDKLQPKLFHAVWQQVGKQLMSESSAKGGRLAMALKQIDSRKVHEWLTSFSGNCCYGQHDSSWLGFYDFIRCELGLVEETKSLEGLTELAQHTGWCLPMQSDGGVGICICAERPKETHLDEEQRLHSTTGPVCSWDDWQAYYYHGVAIPKWIITEKEKLTAKKILDEPNAEVRRAMMEIMGLENFIKDADAKVIDACPEHQVELLELPLPENDPEGCIRVLKMTDFSPHERAPHERGDGDMAEDFYRTYLVRVPVTHEGTQRMVENDYPYNLRSALHMLACSYSCTPEEYKLSQQT